MFQTSKQKLLVTIGCNLFVMTTIIAQPKDIKADHLKQILDLIIKGGQVNPDGLQVKILRADLVAYILQDDHVICTATLKNPYLSYRKKIFNSAQAKSSSEYNKELGYIVTNPNFENKGHCQKLIKTFFNKISEHSIYATTRKPSMVHILGKFGFSQTGKIYNQDLKLLTYNGKK